VSARRLIVRLVPLFAILLAAVEGGWKWDLPLH
jgi:hypothetical protein